MKQTIKKNMSQTNTKLGEGLNYQISHNWKLILCPRFELRGPFIFKMFTNVRQNRSEISKELKGKSGIYLWFNTTNNKFYVGQASNLYLRIARYLTPSFYLFTANTQVINSSIRSAFRKYGSEAFVLIILEFCERSQLDNPALN